MEDENKEYKESTDISGYGALGKMEKKSESESRPFLSAMGKPHIQTKLTDWIIRLSRGYIKTETQAIYVLLTIVALIFIVSFIIFFTAGADVRKVMDTGLNEGTNI